MRSAWEEVFFFRQCIEAFNNALREAEVAFNTGDVEKLSETLCYASGLIDNCNEYVDPRREGDPDPVTEELRAKVLEACKRLLPRSSLH